jgi:hypothetical protein
MVGPVRAVEPARHPSQQECRVVELQPGERRFKHYPREAVGRSVAFNLTVDPRARFRGA